MAGPPGVPGPCAIDPGYGAAMVPEVDVHRVLRWAGGHNHPDHLHELRIEVDVSPTSITVMECRPRWEPDAINAQWIRFPIARLRFIASKEQWSLYWRDRNLAFHRYERVPPTMAIEELLAEIDRDPTGIFWG